SVRTVNGIPVADAYVSLPDFTLLGLSPVRLTQLGLLTPLNPGFTTNEEGIFSMGLLPPGIYKLKIAKGNHLMETSVSISSGQEIRIQAVLE
ncbi:MAG: carboxypeptidase-like regulatory domain-containing protein, partial [Planctomycetota bacterium]